MSWRDRDYYRRSPPQGGWGGGPAEISSFALPKPTRIDHVVIMEDIAHGERVREYVVEGLVGGGTWKPLCKGTAIGHKRIEQFDTVQTSKIRLRVTKARATPRIRSLAVYGVD